MSELVDAAELDELDLLDAKSYDLWSKLYPGEEYMDEDSGEEPDVVAIMEESGDDPEVVRRLLIQYLCILDDSSDYAEAFDDPQFEALSEGISAKVPTKMPCDLLTHLSELLCFVTYGYGQDDEEDEESEKRWPVWLHPLLDACVRCCAPAFADGDISGAFHAVMRVLQSDFRKAVKSHPNIDAVFACAAKTLTNPSAKPAVVVEAAELLAVRLCNVDPADGSILEAFLPLRQLLQDRLNSTQPDAGSALQTKLTAAIATHAFSAARSICRTSAGRQELAASGFVETAIAYAKNKCIPILEQPIAYKSIQSAASFLAFLVTPDKIKVEANGETDKAKMQALFNDLQSKSQEICNQVLAAQGEDVLCAALVGNESGDHLSNTDSHILGGLLALLAFSSPEISRAACNKLDSNADFFNCIATHHAVNKLYTRSGKWASGIMGLTKVAAIARLFLSCFFPAHFPHQSVVNDSEHGRKRPAKASGPTKVGAKKAQPDEEKVIDESEPLFVPSPAETVAASLPSRPTNMRKYLFDDWMLALVCLESRPCHA